MIDIREANANDVTQIARLRSLGWGDEAFWIPGVANYMNGSQNPQMAKAERMVYLATDEEKVIGFIAGHLTNRLGCEGELQWIDIDPTYRRKGIASQLVEALARWFISHHAYNICVDPGNDQARRFYLALGAQKLDDHWMFWKNINTIIKQ